MRLNLLVDVQHTIMTWFVLFNIALATTSFFMQVGPLSANLASCLNQILTYPMCLMHRPCQCIALIRNGKTVVNIRNLFIRQQFSGQVLGQQEPRRGTLAGT